MPDTSKSKTILITGAGAGIGAETAIHLARQGHNVVVAVRNPGKVNDLVAHLKDAGGDALAVQCDVRIGDEVERAVAKAVSYFGGLDIVINNAGRIDPIGLIAETDPASWRDTLETNLFGAYLVTRVALGQMKNDGGTIINVSTGAAHTAREGWSAYCATKAGLAMFTRSIALEYGAAGIRAFGVQPGVVDTDMQVKIRSSGVNEISKIRREDLLSPSRPAAAIAWLCQAMPEALSGQDLTMDDLRRAAGEESSW